jgi:hypothetical protein
MRLSRYDLINYFVAGIINAASAFSVSTKLRLKLLILLFIIKLAVIIKWHNSFLSLCASNISFT